MDEETKRRVAQFRFGVIHDLIGDRKLSRGERKRLLMDKSACVWEIPYSEGTRRVAAGSRACTRKPGMIGEGPAPSTGKRFLP